MRAKWICYTVLVLLVACNNQPTAVYNRQKAAKHEVQLDIGKSVDGSNYWHQEINETASQLGLDALEEGYDSLQIRVWLGESLAVTNHIVIIRRTNNKWKAELVSYETHALVNNRYVERLSKKIKPVSPKNGWDYIDNKIKTYNIIDLPHGEDMPGCSKGGADGIGYYFEIATGDKYRFYYYSNPDLACDCDLASNVLRFSFMLEREFDFHYLH